MNAFKTDAAQPGPPPKVKVSIVEDDTMVRNELAAQINRSQGFVCVSTHGSAEAGLQEIPKLHPDVVLMDINLPKMSGIDCVRLLKKELPATQFIMLTVYEDEELIFKALRSGAVGYLLKCSLESSAQVLDAIRDAIQGGSPLNSLIARKIVQFFSHRLAQQGPEYSLSARELEVLELLSKGLADKEIASQLKVSIETVRKHCHNIYQKLHVSTRTEAVVKYLGK